MASLPPPRTDRSPRRGLQLKEGTKLPDPPSFEKVSTKSEIDGEANASTRPLPEQEKAEAVEQKPEHAPAAAEEPQDKQTRKTEQKGSRRNLTRGQGDTPLAPEETTRHAAPSAAADTQFVTIRLGFEPKVRELVASGPIATNATFQTQLANERREIEDDIDNFKVYPILQLGLGYRF